MALTNYAELGNSVADWLHRADLATQISDFITLAESEINAELLQMRRTKVDEALTINAGERTVALPSRYIEPISLNLVISGQPNTELTYRQPQQLLINADIGATARPFYWAINGDNIEFPNLSDDTYTLSFRMVKGLDLASTSTNAVLDAYPGLYLYGALLQAAPYLVNDQRMGVIQATYNRILAKAKRAEGRTNALVSLVTDLPNTARLPNIIEG